MMHKYTALDIFEKALHSVCGIELILESPLEAKRTRRRLYAAREKLRSEFGKRFDSLSLLIQHQELWIIRRDQLSDNSDIEVLDSRNLDNRELPQKILSRGKSRVKFHIS